MFCVVNTGERIAINTAKIGLVCGGTARYVAGTADKRVDIGGAGWYTTGGLFAVL